MHQIRSKRVWPVVSILGLLSLPAWVGGSAWAAGDTATAEDSVVAEAQPTASNGTSKKEEEAAGECASTWQQVAGTDLPGRFGSFNSVEVISKDDVWAVGSDRPGTYISMADTFVEHWDGSIWTRTPSQNQTLFGWVSDLSDIDAVTPNDIWAVGSANDGVNEEQSLLLHWDGTSWTNVPGPPEIENYISIAAVEAIATNDVWAVGATGAYPDVMKAFILHWNGSQWRAVPLPNLGDDIVKSGLQDLVVIAPNDIWAVGFKARDPLYFEGAHQVVLHWDGNTWSEMPTTGLEDPSDTIAVFLTAMTGTAPDDLWVVGYAGEYSYNPFAPPQDPGPHLFTAHWNGSVWTAIPGPPIDTEATALYDVKALASNDIWAVGSSRQGCCFFKTLVLHWDGSAWSVVPSFSSGSGGQLQGIDASPDGELWAAGTYSTDNRMQGLVERYTGDCPQPSPTCTITFSDVPSDNTFYPAVRCMACLGFVSGYEGGTFRPGDTVTRGQMAKMVSNAAGFSDPVENLFGDYSIWADVPITHTFHVYTVRISNHGVASGYKCGEDIPLNECEYNRWYFRPAEKMTRGQIAQFVSRAAFLDEIVPPGQQTFADLLPGQPFWSDIERVAKHGGISGYPCGTRPDEPCDSRSRPYFRSTEHVSRGQAAKFLTNIFYPGCQAQIGEP